MIPRLLRNFRESPKYENGLDAAEPQGGGEPNLSMRGRRGRAEEVRAAEGWE